MPPWLQTIVTVLCALLASSGFWAWFQSRNTRKDVQTKVLIGMAHDRIVHLGMSYVKRRYILKDEYENLYDYLYVPYKAMGGNGSAKRVVEEVKKLPIYESHLDATEAMKNENE